MRILCIPIKGMKTSNITGRDLYGMRLHPTLKVMKMHEGIDEQAPSGTPIYAVADGTVLISKMQGNGKGYGNYIVIKHKDFCSLYAHQSKRVATVGQEVKTGDLIGYVGSTGESSGPHLHFGVCKEFDDRSWVNPLPLLQACEKRLNMTKEQAKEIVKEKAGLSDETIEYLADDFKYGKELIIKLAQAMI